MGARLLHPDGPLYTPALKAAWCHAEKDNGSFVPIIAFDCRGLDPTGWHPEVSMWIIMQWDTFAGALGTCFMLVIV